MYSLLKFLQCHPFDDQQVWKDFFANKSAQGQERMNTLVRTLLLRRTKEQILSLALPKKYKLEHKIKLNDEEKMVYDTVFSFSQSALQRYMDKVSHPEKEEDAHKGEGHMAEQGDVKAHHLLVLLLRLRQICNHPGLIKSMLDTDTMQYEGIEDSGEEVDLISAMEDMNITRDTTNTYDKTEKILCVDNPVFSNDTSSSKIKTVLEELQKIRVVNEKAVIVSQWTSMLDIIKVHLTKIGMSFTEINGQVPAKRRGDIVEDFNKNSKGAQVMLLSLSAGGVGLNLVGANNLFLLDMHWNPQLEAQASDRVYRFGQTREVKIHR